MSEPDPSADRSRRHLRFGWWSLLLFLLLGLFLETLHGFKVGWYLDVGMEPRRLMWTLAHAHGTLVSLINIAFGLTVTRISSLTPWIRRASPCLLAGSLLLPGGFFLGGLTVHGGDPNPGVIVVPLGGLLLIAGVAFTGLALRSPEERAPASRP